MIIALLINFLLLVFSFLFSWLPDASVLPTIGNVNLDYYFATGIGYFKFLAGIFPPLGTITTAATIYLTWRLTVLVLKLVLGSRVPSMQ
jgi:hypothetical protein